MLWDAIATHIYRIQVTFNLTCSLKYPVLWSTTNGSSSWSPIITNVDMHLSSFPRTYNFLNFSVYLPSPQQTLLTNQGERYILRLLVFLILPNIKMERNNLLNRTRRIKVDANLKNIQLSQFGVVLPSLWPTLSTNQGEPGEEVYFEAIGFSDFT